MRAAAPAAIAPYSKYFTVLDFLVTTVPGPDGGLEKGLGPGLEGMEGFINPLGGTVPGPEEGLEN